MGAGRKLINVAIEAPKWRTARTTASAGRTGCPDKFALVRDRFHFGGPEGFDQNGSLLSRKTLKYRHIPALSLGALGRSASNLDDDVYEFTD